jgi:DNA-binding NtrC family response regulator
MVVLSPSGEIKAADIPREIRESGLRNLPVPVPSAMREVAGQELQYIVQSLLDLRLQVEDLRRRLDEIPQRVEVIELGRQAVAANEGAGTGEVYVGRFAGAPGGGAPLREQAPGIYDVTPAASADAVVYEAGMKMAEVEKAAITAALRATRGNRRKAAESLGIGERTLYRKLKEYQLEGETSPRT